MDNVGYIDSALIRKTVCDLCIRANTVLPDDVLCAIGKSREAEGDTLAGDVMDMLLDNAALAADQGVPICQDTGLAHVFLDLGQDIVIRGDLNKAVAEGVALGYTQGCLRKSVVRDPLFDRVNTGDNAPPVIHVEIVSGSDLTITVMPKGTGSENMSAVAMLTPAAGPPGVKRFVLDTVRKAGANACPPMVVGVGVGGMMDKATYLAKRALLREIGRPNPDEEVAAFEADLLEEINRMGIGPAGLGGLTTALWVAVETYPTHIGALPVAVNLQCHAARRATAVLRSTGEETCGKADAKSGTEPCTDSHGGTGREPSGKPREQPCAESCKEPGEECHGETDAGVPLPSVGSRRARSCGVGSDDTARVGETGTMELRESGKRAVEVEAVEAGADREAGVGHAG